MLTKKITGPKAEEIFGLFGLAAYQGTAPQAQLFLAGGTRGIGAIGDGHNSVAVALMLTGETRIVSKNKVPQSRSLVITTTTINSDKSMERKVTVVQPTSGLIVKKGTVSNTENRYVAESERPALLLMADVFSLLDSPAPTA